MLTIHKGIWECATKSGYRVRDNIIFELLKYKLISLNEYIVLEEIITVIVGFGIDKAVKKLSTFIIKTRLSEFEVLKTFKNLQSMNIIQYERLPKNNIDISVNVDVSSWNIKGLNDLIAILNNQSNTNRILYHCNGTNNDMNNSSERGVINEQ